MASLNLKMKKRENYGTEPDKKKLAMAGIRHQLLLLLRRRHRLFPLVSAFSGCLLLLLLFSFSFPPVIHRSPPGRKNQIAVEPKLLVPENGGRSDRHLWSSKLSNSYYGCSNASDTFQVLDKTSQTDRYLLIATSGGLNQQRTGIIDAVVAAYILNATLVIPKLDQNSYWKDTSNFEEIFDVDWFITHLSKDVKIIKELPKGEESRLIGLQSIRVPRKCTPSCYLQRVLPLLKKKHVVQLSKFDYRLANQLDSELQKLRCRVNYHAVRYTETINKMGQTLVDRMRTKSKHFVALHLRFEPDMLAFSGCYYGGGQKERLELGAMRRRWKTLHAANPDKVREHGRCPLTPEEIGLMLRGLGFGREVHLYVASGEVYGGDATLAPLRALFPNIHTKETLTSKKELAPFARFSSRMAALDFIVCDESDAFVTNNNGNMARILAGRRRYMGHKVTIRPNAKKLHKIFTNRHNMTWDEFSTKVRKYQTGFMGEPDEMKAGEGEFHENPTSCICQKKKKKDNEKLKEDEQDSWPWEYSDIGNVPMATRSEFESSTRS
ncbi:protein ROOT HAIR SPECIFIC 17-like [Raphanus sativus]|uniref:O-fucosyltransferase family protein n=1 Tax=Raphanus sativus TaxID=3726 RepID=A0A6J0N069_RAPSA|nr:protein ROOT HAIR SPECIFIC 17 [Raphanus sativus]XP_056855438.1 LOW QUALITY PROTEIN: protein ROOT HAIR SPECIFIC 17-like [Raphanus sativus]XP_056855895.1 protein ROOT HAIR SPECIFIC 17-like [Raphanus sativus]